MLSEVQTRNSFEPDSMKSDRYITRASRSTLEYTFNSEGPKGRIIKRVSYDSVPGTLHLYNLALGDLNEDGNLNDTVITNNKDTRKVLATVAWTVKQFLHKHPHKSIYIEGNTKARTRLYRIAISNNFDSLNAEFEIFGLTGNDWRPFKHNTNYSAFLVHLKK